MKGIRIYLNLVDIDQLDKIYKMLNQKMNYIDQLDKINKLIDLNLVDIYQLDIKYKNYFQLNYNDLHYMWNKKLLQNYYIYLLDK